MFCLYSIAVPGRLCRLPIITILFHVSVLNPLCNL